MKDAEISLYFLFFCFFRASWVKACFDNISHQWILKNIPLPKYILKQWLKFGFIDKRRWFPTQAGTPQGGIISPVIANMVLDGIETILSHFSKHAKVKLVRYADDFIITARTKEILLYQVKPLLEMFLSERGLELSAEKTKITHIEDGFDFLGQNIRKYNGKCLTTPAKKSIKAVYQKIRTIVKANPTMQTAVLIYKLNPIIRGWANYHRHIVSKRVFNRLDDLVYQLLWNWAKRRHPNKPHKWIKEKYFKTKGKRRWVFEGTLKNKKTIELLRFEHTKIIRHSKIKSDANPLDADWKEYFKERNERKKQNRNRNLSKFAKLNQSTYNNRATKNKVAL